MALLILALTTSPLMLGLINPQELFSTSPQNIFKAPTNRTCKLDGLEDDTFKDYDVSGGPPQYYMIIIIHMIWTLILEQPLFIFLPTHFSEAVTRYFVTTYHQIIEMNISTLEHLEDPSIIPICILAENGQEVIRKAKADTGSPENFISQSIIRDLKLDKRAHFFSAADQDRIWRSAGGEALKTYGSISLNWSRRGGSKTWTTSFIVVDGEGFDIILGLKFLTESGCLTWNDSVFIIHEIKKNAKSRKEREKLEKETKERQMKDNERRKEERIEKRRNAGSSSKSQ